MTSRHLLCPLFVALLAAVHAPVLAAEQLKSSLQPGEKIETIFEPLNVNGEAAGKPNCLICENGLSPVAMIFAREVSPALVSLITRLDAEAAQHRTKELGCFVVFLGDEEKLKPKLEAVAKEQKLKHVILAIDAAAGPEGFKVAPEADVTVVLYRKHEVAANHAFAKGQLTDKTAATVVKDLPKILK